MHYFGCNRQTGDGSNDKWNDDNHGQVCLVSPKIAKCGCDRAHGKRGEHKDEGEQPNFGIQNIFGQKNGSDNVNVHHGEPFELFGGKTNGGLRVKASVSEYEKGA